MIVAVLSLAGAAFIAAGQDLVPAANSAVGSIIIDPGHGGYDHGAIGFEGSAEKYVTLALARLTASRLSPRYRVLLTRTGDYQVDAADRIALANHNHADLFISLHIGGGFSKQHGAVTVYYLNAETDQDRSAAAFPGTEVSFANSYVVWDEAHHGRHRPGKAFADIMEQACRDVFGNCCRVKAGRSYILQGANMPAVMVEIGCLNNPFWEKQFRNPERLAVMSNMIGAAIERFFQPDHSVAVGDANH